MSDETFNLQLERRVDRSLNVGKALKQLRHIAARAQAGKRASQGWTLIHKPRLPEPLTIGGKKVYRPTLKFVRKGRKVPKETVVSQFDVLSKIAATAGNASGWHLLTDNEAVPSDDVVLAVVKSTIAFPADFDKFFAHIFDRDAQIGIVYQSIAVAMQSGFANRNHCVLYGPPGCGKSEILKSFKTAFGNDFVMEFDATSTTAAGARKELREVETVPPILICEEIEKTDEGSLRWLLGVLDTRGEIRGCNYRDSSYARDAKLLCLATVNDLAKFNTAMSGALASRFSNKIKCPRPSRAVLERILDREIRKINGNAAWAKPAIDYCLNYEGTDDPRRAIAVALCGQDKLLSGEYQKWLQETSEKKIVRKAPSENAIRFDMNMLF
jgi:hypothetical protein